MSNSLHRLSATLCSEPATLGSLPTCVSTFASRYQSGSPCFIIDACCDNRFASRNGRDGFASGGRLLFLGSGIRRHFVRVFNLPYRVLEWANRRFCQSGAFPNFQMAYCASGSCLRMPRPAGHNRSS